ncbi:MAG: hypothetical protein RR065_01420 [Clostridia bacterium]
MRKNLLQRRLSNRVLAWLCVAALLVSLMPLYAIAFYNHACYDDFGFSILTHAAWRDSGSFGKTLAAAMRNTVGIRDTWEGTYFTSFLSALQPAVFGEGQYWITTVILLSFFLFSLWFFLWQALARGLRVERSTFWMAFACIAFVMVQFVPDMSEAFFWFNGGVAYTLLWSLMLLRLGVWMAFERASRPAGKAACYALLALLTVLVGGGKYSTLLLACLIDALLVAYAFVKKRRERWAELALWLLLLGCFLFSALAPGNQVRAATLHGGMSAPKAVLQAFYFGFALMGHWFSLPLLVVWAVVAWQLAEALHGTALRFNHPLWVTAVCLCLFCSQLAPTLYTGNYIGDGRVVNGYFYTYVLMTCGLVLYWTGWYKRLSAARTGLPALPSSARGGMRLSALCAAIALLLIGFICYHPEGVQSYGPQHMASGSAVRSLASGEAARYDQAMDERDAAMNDPSQPQVALRPVEEIPAAFMGDSLNSDMLDYVLNLYAEYYQKQTVTIEKGE